MSAKIELLSKIVVENESHFFFDALKGEPTFSSSTNLAIAR